VVVDVGSGGGSVVAVGGGPSSVAVGGPGVKVGEAVAREVAVGGIEEPVGAGVDVTDGGTGVLVPGVGSVVPVPVADGCGVEVTWTGVGVLVGGG
jgi:hypothetical protein